VQAQCSAVKTRAPCGQVVDSQDVCVPKGCCYDGTDKVGMEGGGGGRLMRDILAFSLHRQVNPCFYAGGDAVPITDVIVIQACHFDAG
jgi:hypothetical protein